MFLGVPFDSFIWAVIMKIINFVPVILFIFLLFPFMLDYLPKNDILGGVIYLLYVLAMIALPIVCIVSLVMFFLGYFPNYFKSTYPYISILFVLYKIL